MWDAIRQNVRDAARGLRRTPGTAAAVIILLALGIGANATMFEIVRSVAAAAARSSWSMPDRLRMVYAQRPTLSLPQFARNLTYPDVEDLKRPARARSGVAAFTQPRRMTLGTGADARKFGVQLAEACVLSRRSASSR